VKTVSESSEAETLREDWEGTLF